jgi:hypothetical protein
VTEEKEGCQGGWVKEGQNDAISRELAGAMAAGKAPQFEVVRFEANNGWVDESSSRIKIDLALILDGQLVQVLDERVIEERPKNGAAFDGRLGSIDVMECALRRALQERWPEIRQYLEKVEIVSYCAFTADYKQSHHVQVTFKIICDKDETPRAVVREGVDTIGKTRYTLVTIFRWLAWRLLRRLRGEKRARGEC